jgi:hypothetical protein
MEQRREGKTKLKPVGVFWFLREDRWPGFRFDIGATYL